MKKNGDTGSMTRINFPFQTHSRLGFEANSLWSQYKVESKYECIADGLLINLTVCSQCNDCKVWNQNSSIFHMNN